jgi:hypothetical protein
MQGTQIAFAFHVPGTLSANLSIKFKVYRDLILQHVSAVASNDSDATLAIAAGSAGTTALLAAAVIGDSGTPVEKTVSNWATTNPTGRLADGDIVALTLDYDGAGGTAANDVTIVLTCTEG